MTRAPFLLALLASTAFAQNTDVQQRAAEAYVSCLASKGGLDLAIPNFALFGWTDREDTEAGTRITHPDWAESISALLGKDGTTCQVESTQIGTEAALAFLKGPLRFTEYAGFNETRDANGCTVLQLDATATATLTDGKDPEACNSDTTSAIRFQFAP